jgi:hypothetical protein
MKRASVAVLTIFIFTLTGCEITGPKVRIGAPVAVKIQPTSGPGFCPPGQAKKGNC